MIKTGFSLLEILHRENPVFFTGMGLQCGMWYSKALRYGALRYTTSRSEDLIEFLRSRPHGMCYSKASR